MGVDDRRPELYRESRAAAKARLGLPNDAVVLSLFGFVAAYKGHEVAVQALKRLPDRFVLAVVGGPHPEGGDATVDRILRLWAKRDSNRLRITGFVDPPTRDLYQMATDVCLAPYTEGNLASSAGITWGLSSGRPVVASAIPSFRELNEKSSALELVTPGCPAELAWTVQRLITNPARTAELVRNALDYSSQCSWDVVAREVSQIYGELVGRTVGQEPELAKKESHAPFPRLVQAA
jgi:D-inositol-3-phosphate glycosyltransferase